MNDLHDLFKIILTFYECRPTQKEQVWMERAIKQQQAFMMGK